MMHRSSSAVFILTQNTDVRKTHLKTCLYFLFKHFNAEFRYPVHIYHEGDYGPDDQREILTGVRATCRSLVSFHELDPADFTLPAHIDADKMQKCIAHKPVPYWRNAKYRMMCRWWSINVWKYAQGYEYIMRLDDDSIIEEPVQYDIFAWAAENKVAYSSNILSLDCGICNHGFKELLESAFPEKRDLIGQMFKPQDVPMLSVQFHPFRSLLSITDAHALPEMKSTMRVWSMVYFFNNYFVTRVSFWQRPDVQAALKTIDESGLMFYKRLGDAPVHTAIVSLFAAPNEIKRSVFKYSKRIQREAFKGDDGAFYSYMPDTYDKMGCLTETTQQVT